MKERHLGKTTKRRNENSDSIKIKEKMNEEKEMTTVRKI